MTRKTAKLIFLVGTLVSAVLFLALTWDTHRQMQALTHADRLSDDVVAGKKVFQKYNCNDCHTILGFGGYYAPDLTRVYSRRGEAYIREILAKPEVVLEKSFRKMPQQNLTPQEIDRLVDFFRWVDGIENNDWPPQDSKKRGSAGVRRLVGGTTLSRGAALFKESGCFDCHSLHGVGGSVGPALDDVGSKLTVEELKQQIANPQMRNPASKMPPFEDLSEADLQALAEFLAKQTGGGQ